MYFHMECIVVEERWYFLWLDLFFTFESIFGWLSFEYFICFRFSFHEFKFTGSRDTESNYFFLVNVFSQCLLPRALWIIGNKTLLSQNSLSWKMKVCSPLKHLGQIASPYPKDMMENVSPHRRQMKLPRSHFWNRERVFLFWFLDTFDYNSIFL